MTLCHPLDAVQSQNIHDNKSDSMFENNVDVNNREAGDNLANTKSTSEFFDPKQMTTLCWAPTKEFGAFLEKNFRRRMTTDQVNEIVGEFAPPDLDTCVAPTLDKNILTYIPGNRKKFVKQRDRDLALVQRAMLNAAAPFCCLHDRLESNEDIPKNELLCALQQSLCLLGSSNHITTTLRHKKILGAINPDKVKLAKQEFTKAGKLLFGEDLPNLATKHSELTKSLSKDLQKPYSKTQPYASGNFPWFPSHGHQKYNSQQFRSKSGSKPFCHSTSTGKQRLVPDATSGQPFRPRRDQSDKHWPRQY